MSDKTIYRRTDIHALYIFLTVDAAKQRAGVGGVRRPVRICASGRSAAFLATLNRVFDTPSLDHPLLFAGGPATWAKHAFCDFVLHVNFLISGSGSFRVQLPHGPIRCLCETCPTRGSPQRIAETVTKIKR